jgi:UDP-N-acetylglucosamine:LPS N-acetylglucosamine transferase
MKIGIISSCGGHLTEIRALRAVYEKYPHFYVLNDRIELSKDMQGKTFFIRHSERDALFFVNVWEAWKILRREKPTLLLSTGAGPIVPFALIGKLLGVKTFYIEIGTQVNRPSLTGRCMYYLADRFYYQWEELRPYFPKAIFGGLLL